MSFKLSMIILGVTCLTSQLFAQTISINPKNVAQFGSISTGNKVGSKCNGLSNDYLKLTIQPSCYGANLRGGGNVLEPSQGNIIMNLKIYNFTKIFFNIFTNIKYDKIIDIRINEIYFADYYYIIIIS